VCAFAVPQPQLDESLLFPSVFGALPEYFLRHPSPPRPEQPAPQGTVSPLLLSRSHVAAPGSPPHLGASPLQNVSMQGSPQWTGEPMPYSQANMPFHATPQPQPVMPFIPMPLPLPTPLQHVPFGNHAQATNGYPTQHDHSAPDSPKPAHGGKDFSLSFAQLSPVSHKRRSTDADEEGIYPPEGKFKRLCTELQRKADKAKGERNRMMETVANEILEPMISKLEDWK